MFCTADMAPFSEPALRVGFSILMNWVPLVQDFSDSCRIFLES
jgi:hypothetical protein